MFLNFKLLLKAKKIERFRFFEVCHYIAGIDMALILPKIQFHNFTASSRKVDVVQIDPERVWRQSGFEKIDQSFLIGNRSPSY